MSFKTKSSRERVKVEKSCFAKNNEYISQQLSKFVPCHVALEKISRSLSIESQKHKINVLRWNYYFFELFDILFESLLLILYLENSH